MKIIKTYGWNRRDFSATMQCQNCGNTQENRYCYDDSNYYNNVIPAIECVKCGESTNSLGLIQEPQSTKYDPNITI